MSVRLSVLDFDACGPEITFFISSGKSSKKHIGYKQKPANEIYQTSFLNIRIHGLLALGKKWIFGLFLLFLFQSPNNKKCVSAKLVLIHGEETTNINNLMELATYLHLSIESILCIEKLTYLTGLIWSEMLRTFANVLLSSATILEKKKIWACLLAQIVILFLMGFW